MRKKRKKKGERRKNEKRKEKGKKTHTFFLYSYSNIHNLKKIGLYNRKSKI